MTEDAIFKEQWSLLKKEMAMGDAHLQQRLEQFIFRQYGRAVLAHYIKAFQPWNSAAISTCGSAGGAVPSRSPFSTGPCLRKQPST